MTGRRRILMVDDDPLFQALLIEALQPLGLEIETAGDGLAALESIERQPPALLITDRQMPRMDGLTLMRRLREDPRTSALPILMITGMHGAADMRLAIETGASAFLPKPIDPELVRNRVLGLLGEGA